ncbi:S8 family peptidase [Aquimarina sp. U1-2]|uniref:S8 family peptidase n=1 Tax=Aquimarina sp. U1-2 TaxID=2823141 RepID=UPI001AED0470|nr:S8 family peptidase [Aquimarina sp. U1-2]MBP2831268.1 S8 family peptidase [Aquimarina sp. U1-2]
MAKKPLLIFPSPTTAEKSRKFGSSGNLFFPSKGRQIERHEDKITELERVLTNKSAALQQEAGNIIPEMILVLETVGEISDFFKAVRKTPGMKFLAEYESEIDPDEDFYILDDNGNKTDKSVDSRFYLTMTNQEALRELQKYWKEYKKDKQQQDFRRGTTNFRTLFEQLRDIRPYNIEDRVRDTGIQDYIDEIKAYDHDIVKFEIELAYREDQQQNENAYQEVVRLLHLNEGNEVAGSRVVISQIQYHAFIAEAPIQAFDNLTENTNISFLKSQQILFFRPVGQIIFETPAEELQLPTIEEPEDNQVNGQPIAALLDGLPLENHVLLQNRIQVDDPDEFGVNYLGSQRYHGTAMSSLILHGDLDDLNSVPLDRPLYVRPIMKLNSGFNPGESLPDDILPIDLVHRAIIRMKIGEGETPPTAPLVKIINFSIGDAFRPFHSNISSWAKLLDWLAGEYDLLFIVSAGNHADDITLEIPEAEFDNLSEDQVQKLALEEIVKTNYSRKILTPAESINALTVGASHYDSSKIANLYQRKNIINSSELLSPISRIGFGYKRSIKPEILMPGGRKLYRKAPIQNDANKTTLRIETTPFTANPPGSRSALPGAEGRVDATGYLCGTSNSAALTTRLAVQLYEVLLTLTNEEGRTVIDTGFFTVIIKSLLVHSASWGEKSSLLLDLIKNLPGTAANTSKKNILPYLGYGHVDPQRILYSTDKRVTLLGYGKLSSGGAHLYRFPLPPSLSTDKIEKRLTITLAYHSPLNFNTRKYRKAQLYFDNVTHNGHLDLSRSYYDFRTTQLGTTQHDILQGDKADVFIDNDYLEIKVNCREDASGLEKTFLVKYGLAVTLEVKEDVDITIYEEIKQRLQTRIRPTT